MFPEMNVERVRFVVIDLHYTLIRLSDGTAYDLIIRSRLTSSAVASNLHHSSFFLKCRPGQLADGVHCAIKSRLESRGEGEGNANFLNSFRETYSQEREICRPALW